MKKLSRIIYCNVALLFLILLLVGCSQTDSSKNDSASVSKSTTESDGIKTNTSNSNSDSAGKKSTTNTDKSKSDTSGNNSAAVSKTTTGSIKSQNKPNNNSSSDENRYPNNTAISKDDNTLSKYSSKKIEYARVWLQLEPNQVIDELNVRHIKAGEPLNPKDETSAKYPRDVIQLTGSRLVDGSVTYCGNGDGTINVYNVPLRWDGTYPAGTKFYTELIKNSKLVHINRGNDKKIINLINKINFH